MRLRSLVSVIDEQPIASAPRRLQIQWIGWVALDLAAQPVHLNIDGALVGSNTETGKGFPSDGFAWVFRQKAQHRALSVGQPYNLTALAQFSAAKIEGEIAKMHRGWRPRH